MYNNLLDSKTVYIYFFLMLDNSLKECTFCFSPQMLHQFMILLTGLCAIRVASFSGGVVTCSKMKTKDPDRT